jgi:hypothetical protein
MSVMANRGLNVLASHYTLVLVMQYTGGRFTALLQDLDCETNMCSAIQTGWVEETHTGS